MRLAWVLGVVCVVLPVALGLPVDPVDGKGQIWAVLVAGSNGYDNYRHQADVCHAYQIFHRHGIPDSNIIVMMYDDIANNEENPKKGKVFNKIDGPDVYKGVLKDYTGKQVTPENFVHVLTGNAEAMVGVGSGKVLKSGPNDHVFVNFVDHGGPGIIGFPSTVMYADDLIKALKTMHKKNMYKKLVFYMEACESGSMFSGLLPNNIQIFATTAANPDESSYACYYSDELQTYLGDEYSVAWMEDIDSEEHHKNITTETLKKQYKNVVERVTESHPSMYGEKKNQKEHVMDYLGASKDSAQARPGGMQRSRPHWFKDSVPSRDVALHTLRRNLLTAKSLDRKKILQKQIIDLLKARKEVDELFKALISHVTKGNDEEAHHIERDREEVTLDLMPCYKTLVNSFSEECVSIPKNSYVLSHLYKFVNLCARGQTEQEDVLEAFHDHCSDRHRALSGAN